MCINCIHFQVLPTVVDAMLHVFMVLSTLYHRPFLFLFLLHILDRHSWPAHIGYLHFTLWRFWHFRTFLALCLSPSLSLSGSSSLLFTCICSYSGCYAVASHFFPDCFFSLSPHLLWLSIHAYKRIIACIRFSVFHRSRAHRTRSTQHNTTQSSLYTISRWNIKLV